MTIDIPETAPLRVCRTGDPSDTKAMAVLVSRLISSATVSLPPGRFFHSHSIVAGGLLLMS